MNYFVAFISGVILILHIFRILSLFWKPKFLQHKIFEFPDNKYSILGYYLCAVVLLLFQIFLKLGIIS